MQTNSAPWPSREQYEGVLYPLSTLFLAIVLNGFLIIDINSDIEPARDLHIDSSTTLQAEVETLFMSR